MADLSKLIDKKAEAAQYMVDEITHICTTMPKRGPGDEGEKVACEHMANVLKKDCGCERSDVEPFKLNPNSFMGWIYITVTLAIISMGLYFVFPILGVALIIIGLIIMVLEFGLYKKVVDKLFPEKTSHNVTAIKKCTGEVKARIFLNGHPDAAWNWPVNDKFGGKAYAAHVLISVIGSLILLGLSIASAIINGFAPTLITPTNNPVWFYLGVAIFVFLPPLIGMYFMWDEKKVVDGANDNLSGCYMGIALLKALKEEGIEFEHTEVGVILTGSEEAGLRGAKAWCEAHKGEFEDVPTWIFAFDTIREIDFLAVNYRDLNATVKSDKEVGDFFFDTATEMGIKCNKGMVPPFGGATDAAAFTQAGFKSAGITALNHDLQNYYHTMRDTADNMDKDCLAECYAVAVKCLEKFDKMHK